MSSTTLAGDIHNPVNFVPCHALAFLIDAHFTAPFLHKHVVI
jgi:hypothetical protein